MGNLVRSLEVKTYLDPITGLVKAGFGDGLFPNRLGWDNPLPGQGGAEYTVTDPQYGVIADNSADNSSAIQAVLDAAPEGAVIIFPPPAGSTGKYRFATTLTPKSGQILRGSGRRAYQASSGGTVLSYTGTGHAFTLTSDYAVTFEDMTIEIGASGTSCVHLADPTGACVFERVNFRGSSSAAGTGVLMDGQVTGNSHHSFYDCTFHDLLVGARLSGAANANLFDDCQFLAIGTGIDVEASGSDTIGGGNNHFDRCEFDGSTTLGIKIVNGNGNLFTKCVTDGTTSSLSIDPSGGSSADNVFVSCSFEDAITDSGTRTSFIACIVNGSAYNLMRRTKSIFIKGQDFTIRTGTPALAPQGSNTRYTAWAFDGAGATETILTDFLLPIDYLTGNLVVKLYWTNLGAGSGDVAWSLRMRSTADAVDLNDGASETVSTQAITAPALGILKVSTHAIAPPGSANVFYLYLSRISGDASDTLTNDAGLLGVEIQYTADWR